MSWPLNRAERSSHGHRHRYVIRPRGSHRPLEAEQIGQVVALLPGREQLTDPAEGVATVQQLADDPQPVQVSLRVPADPSLTPRRWKELSLLVVAQCADRDPGRAGEFADAVLTRGRRVVRSAVRIAMRRATSRIHLRKRRRPEPVQACR